MATGRISKTTLGLRFMQNAQSKQENEEIVASVAAKANDDGEWHIRGEVREAWGINTSSTHEEGVSHEMSYIPFLYSSETSEQPKGRRTFSRHGKELKAETRTETLIAEAAVITKEKNDAGKSFKGQVKSISSATTRMHAGPSKDKPKNAKSARAVIYDNAGVGVDLPKAKAATSDTTAGSRTDSKEFLKPADIPDPRASSRDRATVDPGADIIHGARSKPKRPQPGSEGIEEPSRKRKKKKNIEQPVD